MDHKWPETVPLSKFEQKIAASRFLLLNFLAQYIIFPKLEYKWPKSEFE